jgi:hypothetical protein
MGIKLDWEIEAEQAQVRNTGEDKEFARQRRLARLRVLALIVFVLLIMGGIVGAVVLRLRDVDNQIEQVLRDTVDAEIASLRIGDRAAFLASQRSATNDWPNRQERLFDDYQTLKVEHDVRLTGRIVDLLIDHTRARVRVEEIIDGVPYSRVWFYWRYDDGWRHVPPDYTFWGEVQVANQPGVSVRYQTVDAALALAMATQISQWVSFGCSAVDCTNLPEISVEILPDESLSLGWAAANPWAIQVPSPSTGRARLDNPFDIDLQLEVSNLLSDRLVAQATNNLQPAYPSDAVFVRQTVMSWLVSRFMQLQADSLLIDSLAQHYGAGALGRLLQALQPSSDISVVNQAAGTPSLEQADLDWRDFLTWRLNLESELIARRDEANFLNLYDTSDETARNIAQGRYNAQLPAEPQTVTAVAVEIDGNGVAHLRAQVQVGSGDSARTDEVIFRLVNGAWRRVN